MSEAEATEDPARCVALNAAQRAVVDAGGGAMWVVAGAGTGKTRTLTHRVARLLELGVRPEALCLLTFTNRAAREMLERVKALGYPGADAIWGGTFHSVANRTLRQHAHLLGYPRNFNVIDAADAQRMMGEAVVEAGLPRTGAGLPGPSKLLSVYSACVNTELTLEGALALQAPRALERAALVREVFVRYMQRKQDLFLMDFDDLLIHWHRLLTEVDTARGYYASRFEHVLVDEYQDTNALQVQIVDRLAELHGNVMIVGDDCQSIYAFRGVDWRNILRFGQRHPHARAYRLETNYRSTPEILRLANASIAFNTLQVPKTLQPTRPAGARPVLVRCRNAQQEARFVAQHLGGLREELGLAWSDMAVLYRAHRHGNALQEALSAEGVPFVVRSGVRFFEQPHIKDLLAHLRLAHNPRDALALERCVALLPGLGARSVDKLAALVRVAQEPFQALADPRTLKLLPAAGQAGYYRLLELLHALLDPARGMVDTPRAALAHVLDAHYRPLCRARYDDAETRLGDFPALLDYAEGFSAWGELLGELTLLSSTFAQDVQINTAEGDAQDRGVCLTTVHQAKGLEWPVVVLVGAAELLFPGPRADTPEALAEERRLFYVAVTRAQSRLVVTWPARVRGAEGAWTWTEPSRFVAELDDARDPQRRPLFETWRLAEDDDG